MHTMLGPKTRSYTAPRKIFFEGLSTLPSIMCHMMVMTRDVPLQASKGARLAMRSLACPLVGSSAFYDCMQSCDLLGCGTRVALRKHRCPGAVLICLPFMAHEASTGADATGAMEADPAMKAFWQNLHAAELKQQTVSLPSDPGEEPITVEVTTLELAGDTVFMGLEHGLSGILIPDSYHKQWEDVGPLVEERSFLGFTISINT